MTVTKLHFSSLKSSSSISVKPNLSSVSVLSARSVRYTTPTATTSAIEATPRVYSGTYTQISSVLNISFTATYAVTATDYYFSGTGTDITVRYVGPGGYDSIQNATTATAGLAPTPGTYIYVTNTTTNINDTLNSTDVNLVFAYSTLSYYISTSGGIGYYPSPYNPLITIYGNRAGNLVYNGTGIGALIYNFTDLTPCITPDTSATQYSTVTSTSIGSQIISYGYDGSVASGATYRFPVFNSSNSANNTSLYPFYNTTTSMIIAGPGTNAVGANSVTYPDLLLAVNVWTGTNYRSEVTGRPISIQGQLGNDVLISAALGGPLVSMTGGGGNDIFTVASPRYAFTGSLRVIMGDVGTTDYVDFRNAYINSTGTFVSTSSNFSGGRASQGTAGTYFQFAQNPSTSTTALNNFYLGLGNTNTQFNPGDLSMVTTGTLASSASAGQWYNVILTNLTLTLAANALGRGNLAVSSQTNWTNLVGTRDLYSTQTIFINGMGS